MRSSCRTRPRPSRVATTLAAVAVAAATLAPGAAAAASGPVRPTRWAQRVCTAVARWNTEVASAAPSAPGADPAAARAALTGSLAQALVATDTLVRSLRSAGTPAVSHGTTMRKVLVSGYSEVGRRLADAVGTARALPVDDPAAFTRGAATLQATLQDTITGADAAFATAARRHPSRALDRAVARAQACRRAR